MRSDQLPLDGRAYVDAVGELEELVRATPDLSNLARIREFLGRAPSTLMGVRTAEECYTAEDEKLRVLIHYMILASSAMADLHAASRNWLTESGYSHPPWATTPENLPCRRMIVYGGRIGAIVSWEPERSLTVAEGLADVERHWVLAMAIGAGERPDWKEANLQHFAAYLTMGGASFASDRQLSDAAIAAKYEVPEAVVAIRRALADVDP